MSTALAPERSRIGTEAGREEGPPETEPARARFLRADRAAIGLLSLCFAALTALTWRRWGVPELDAGAELTTADLVKHGALLYRDVRYYYGPVGLYSLALAFKLFGTSYTVAFAFGLAQAAAILAAFYALSRQWLAPLAAGISTSVLMAIGFSGTAFNFVLPHTNSATFGLLFLLLALLALSRERLVAAGFAVGMVGLTRPEFLAVAAGAVIAFLLARWRFEGRGAMLRAAPRLIAPAVLVPGVVLGYFAARVGVHTLIAENLWPVKFIKGGAKTESYWIPLTPASAVALLARAGVYLGLLAALIASVEGWRRRAGARRLLALWPLAATLLAIAIADGFLRATGLLSTERLELEHEARHLMIALSWLPALGFAAAVVAARRLLRRGESPLGRAWPADLALIVVAAGLGLRAYNAFTTYDSYAAYYAAPLVLLLGILHARIAARRPRAAAASMAALALAAAGLAAYALGGLYRHDNTVVHTARGTFMTSSQGAGALQSAVASVDRLTAPGQHILAAPLDGGIYFMTDRTPALRELSVLPGLIVSAAEQRAAIARLRRDHVGVALIGARDFSDWGSRTFGVNYDSQIGEYVRRHSASSQVLGTLAAPVAGTNPSLGFMLYRLRD